MSAIFKRLLLEKHLHIVCLTIPYPVDYGGVIDLFYKLGALKEQGVKVHLHCFKYDREEQTILNTLCETVQYYSRKFDLSAIYSVAPYIVKSRRSSTLANHLAADNYPILVEGVHCTWLLQDKRFRNRRFFLRLHNVEYIYYKNLYRYESVIWKKLYFLLEGWRLKRYEGRMAKKTTVLAVSQQDASHYKRLGCPNAAYVPIFLPSWSPLIMEGKGSFCLYHGDLSVAENDKAAKWLLREVFNKIDIPFVIAGKDPSRSLVKMAHANPFSCLIPNPGQEEMQDLIQKAHINVIPSYNTTGIKLKFINALYNGRHCLVNRVTTGGSGLEETCVIAEGAEEFKEAIKELFTRPFTSTDLSTRYHLLNNTFNNEKSARQIVEMIWS